MNGGCKAGIDHCSCTYTSCGKRGNCCQCVLFHRSRGEVTGCFFSPEGERSYDRSLENFVRDAARRQAAGR
ncbi:hypothetical protein EDC39_10276 [Geothermobacter ehrlichii]|uniref:Uncharacterized protein n=1 Tax=Geothermobacter ehrlichii TaxID=213224 RepID=A0A5D3WM26_9BACT|nr:DUF6485 family protein [Geothermobacter ehrlichii]TYO99553.1 hypothetical protein EDC39_10276 [Geothermobacter ehrlichii]